MYDKELTDEDWNAFNEYMISYEQYAREILEKRKEKIKKIWQL